MIDKRIYQPQPVVIPVNSGTVKTGQAAPAAGTSGGVSFNQVLNKELQGVQFSQHALQRLKDRNIKLGQAEIQKLNQAIDKVAQKGAKESVVFMNNSSLALVVSVKNKTVITAMDGANIKDNVFTNIDSAVVI